MRRTALVAVALLILLLLLASRWLLSEPSTGPAGGGEAKPPRPLPRTGDHPPPPPPVPVRSDSRGVQPPKPSPPAPGPVESESSKASEPPAAAAARPGVCKGRVVDGVTGKPIAGARVLYGMTGPDGADLGWHGDRTKEDGAFSFDVLETMARDAGRKVEEAELRDRTFDLRIRAAGYEPLRFRAPASEFEARLVPDPTPPLPGRVRGIVTNQDGTAFHGRLKVESSESEWGWYACPYAWTDEQGNYVLEGIPASNWKMRVSAGGDYQTVSVPEDGEAWLTLKVPPSGIDEGSDRFPAASREVIVTGLPGDSPRGSFVRAETRPGHFFRAAVKDGSARFSALPIRGWHFVLERPGFEEAAFDTSVVAGDGAQSMGFPAR